MLFERPEAGHRAVILNIVLNRQANPDVEEFAELALSAGAVVVDELVSSRRRPDSKYFIGKGKLQDLQKKC